MTASRRDSVRVALLTSITHGGPVEHAVLLAHGLTNRGVDVLAVCANSAVAERFRRAGAEAAIVPLRRPGDLRQAIVMWQRIGRVDVVHSHDRRTALWSQLLSRPSRATRLVHTVHGIAHPYLPRPVGTSRHGLRDRLAYEVVEPLAARRADALVVPSRAVADDVARRLRWPRSKMVVIPNGVDTDAIPFRFATGDRVGTVSRLDPFKGLDIFLRAAKLVRAAEPGTRFVMFGTGEQGEELLKLAKELAVDVDRPGYVPAPLALRQLDVFVLSSYWENAPIALLEAMAAGVPVVATAVWGVPEIAVSGTAQLVPPGDPAALAQGILRLLRDPDLALRQATAARTRVVEYFGAQANADAILAVYSGLLERRRRPDVHEGRRHYG